MIAIFIMILVTVVGVVGRMIGKPVLGNVELVQIMLLVLIMTTLSYAQSEDRHIKIGLIVDRLPKKAQFCLDIFNYVATFLYCLIVAYAFVLETDREMNVTMKSTLVLGVPLYILKIVVVIGFVLWAIESINRIIQRYKSFSRDEYNKEVKG